MCIHRMKIVHRDLKSANCLVNKHSIVKICDFGLSRIMTESTIKDSSSAGTPEWMAPELIRNEPFTEKCDIFSLGVIMWELCTLSRPWEGTPPERVVYAVAHEGSRLEIPEGPLGRLIADCWAEPQERPSCEDILTRLLDCDLGFNRSSVDWLFCRGCWESPIDSFLFSDQRYKYRFCFRSLSSLFTVIQSLHEHCETFACAHVNDGFMEDDGETMIGYLMNLLGSPLLEELEVVKGHLLIKDNGKRVLEVASTVDVEMKSKKPVQVSKIDTSMKVNESIITEVKDIQTNSGTDSDLSIKDTKIVKMVVLDTQSTCAMDLNSNSSKNEHISMKSVFEFSKKGGGNSKLRIPGQSYQNVLEGKKVSFYHKRELSTITIRILNIETSKERCFKEKVLRRGGELKKPKI
ncbi:hypothetical protein KSS87_019639 [Heliosperma pusillum]|nr:hypothetical protein KSS87_019639 [Heliosperma pusillum]